MAVETGLTLMTASQDEFITDAVSQHSNRLLGFIRNRVNDATEAEDILQDVFTELTSVTRMQQPVEQVAAWLFRVARNKIIDRYRKKSTVQLDDQPAVKRDDDEEAYFLSELLPAAGRDAVERMDNALLMSAIEEALDELPPEQRNVFMMHELENKSFQEIAAITGAPVNTLLSRKRYAVLHLRRRLSDLYQELFTD